MELTIQNNHLLVEVETDGGKKVCVVDTGSPSTFFFDETYEFILDGMSHDVGLLGGLAKATVPHGDVNKLIGREIDGFIGSDLMLERGEVLIDLKNKQISFGTAEVHFSHTVPIHSFLGIPTFKVAFNGRELLTAFDTGARYPFVHTSLVDEIGLTSTYDTIPDFSPMFGPFMMDLHKGAIAVAGIELGTQTIATSPTLNLALKAVNVEAFLGIDSLPDCSLLISYTHNLIGIDKPL